MTKGSNAERELCEELWQKGYAVLRAPGSGSIDRPSPDVIAAIYEVETEGFRSLRNQKLLAFEVKCKSDGTAYFDQSEIDELLSWSDRCGAIPFAAVKPDLRTFDGWILKSAKALHETTTGYSIRKQDHEDCDSLEIL